MTSANPDTATIARKVLEMIGRGVAGADVAKAAGCSRAAVYKILAQHGEDIQRSIQPLLDHRVDRS